jgi:hypothetical protein
MADTDLALRRYLIFREEYFWKSETPGQYFGMTDAVEISDNSIGIRSNARARNQAQACAIGQVALRYNCPCSTSMLMVHEANALDLRP